MWRKIANFASLTSFVLLCALAARLLFAFVRLQEFYRQRGISSWSFNPRSGPRLEFSTFWLCGIFAICPILWVMTKLIGRREAASLRRRSGLCVECGYDLTGNVSGVCPECGSPTKFSLAFKELAHRRLTRMRSRFATRVILVERIGGGIAAFAAIMWAAVDGASGGAAAFGLVFVGIVAGIFLRRHWVDIVAVSAILALVCDISIRIISTNHMIIENRANEAVQGISIFCGNGGFEIGGRLESGKTLRGVWHDLTFDGSCGAAAKLSDGITVHGSYTATGHYRTIYFVVESDHIDIHP